MSEDDPIHTVIPSDARIETAATEAVEKAEAAATRRRWISLAEFVAVAGLLVAVASLWMGWSDRRADQAEKQADKAEVSKVRTLVTLTADIDKDGETATLKDSAHQLHDVQVIFPSALGIAPQSGMFGPKIDASWFADKILALTEKGPDKAEGRLPVILAATYWDNDVERTDRAIYDIAWQTEPGVLRGLLRGRRLRMHAVSLRSRTGTAAALDAAWARQKPAG